MNAPVWSAVSALRAGGSSGGVHAAAGDAPQGRQGHGDGGADARLALQPQRAAMHHHERMADGQAEAGARMLAAEMAVNLAERRHDAHDVVGGDADARVGDLIGELIGGADIEPENDLAARWREFDGIGDQVQQHLLHGAGIEPVLRDVAIDAELDLQPGVLGAAGHEAQHSLGHLHRIDVFLRQREPAGLDLREVEDVVDQRQQMLAAFMDIAGILPVMPVAQRTEHLGDHHLGEAEDGVKRRAQLMAHIGQEFRFRAVGDFGLVAGRHGLLLGAAVGGDVADRYHMAAIGNRAAGQFQDLAVPGVKLLGRRVDQPRLGQEIGDRLFAEFAAEHAVAGIDAQQFFEREPGRQPTGRVGENLLIAPVPFHQPEVAVEHGDAVADRSDNAGAERRLRIQPFMGFPQLHQAGLMGPAQTLLMAQDQKRQERHDGEGGGHHRQHAAGDLRPGIAGAPSEMAQQAAVLGSEWKVFAVGRHRRRGHERAVQAVGFEDLRQPRRRERNADQQDAALLDQLIFRPGVRAAQA